MPCGRSRNPRTRPRSCSHMPSLSRSTFERLVSTTRITTFSPLVTGSVETRMSMRRPPISATSRPSCGMRFSAMSRFESTFKRDTIALCVHFGSRCSSRSRPSTRKRTTSSLFFCSMPLALSGDSARPLPHGPAPQPVREPDDGAALGLAHQLVQRLALLGLGDRAHHDLVLGLDDALHDLVHRGVEVVVTLDRLADLRGRGQHRLDEHAGVETEVLER